MACRSLLRRCADVLLLQDSAALSGTITYCRSVTSGSTSGTRKRFYDRAQVAAAEDRPVRILLFTAYSDARIDHIDQHVEPL